MQRLNTQTQQTRMDIDQYLVQILRHLLQPMIIFLWRLNRQLLHLFQHQILCLFQHQILRLFQHQILRIIQHQIRHLLRLLFQHKLHQTNKEKNISLAHNLYDNFEGRQSLLYRKKWSLINEYISMTMYYCHMKGFMDALNEYHIICGKAKHFLSEYETERAREVCKNMVYFWNKFEENILVFAPSPKQQTKEKEKEKREKKKNKNDLNLLDMNAAKLTLGAKRHYYPHGVQYQEIWKMSLGYADEESVEKFHKVCTAVFLRYESQRGLKRVGYAMNQLLLMTSPKYAQ